MRSAPQRFVETWIDAVLGFLFCVVLPIPLYATGEPFAAGFAATESTIIATAVGYSVVWYCGRRLDAFPRATLQGNVGYVAPFAVFTYAVIAALLLLLRLDYSRTQLFGSGFLTLLWMAGVRQLRSPLPDPQLRGDPALVGRRHAGPRDLPMARLRRRAAPWHAGRCHRRRPQRRPRRGQAGAAWPTPRSPACRCSIGATSSRR
jgi:hypothetical protein